MIQAQFSQNFRLRRHDLKPNLFRNLRNPTRDKVPMPKAELQVGALFRMHLRIVVAPPRPPFRPLVRRRP